MFTSQAQAVVDQVDQLRHKVDDHWQVPAEEARALAALVLACGSRSICEIGTSYGFSTLHLAGAAATLGGHVHSFDMSPKKNKAAGEHLRQAGLDKVVSLHLGDARETLGQVRPDRPYDFAFIDATKEQSMDYLTALWPRLAGKAVLVTDNTTTHAKELAGFVAHLRQLPGVYSCGMTVGNGFELSVKLG